MATAKELRRSKFNSAGTRKTCPRCSVLAGKYIYKSIGSYGERTMPSGDVIPQSWCSDCRHQSASERATGSAS